MELWAIWVIIGLVAIIIEIFTVGLAVICFATGAFGAAIAAYFGASVVWQMAIFSVVTILSLITIRPIVQSLLTKRKEANAVTTNLDALVGRRATVTQEIHGGEGRVSLDGDDWKAEIDDLDLVIEVGEKVEVVKVESVVLIIKKI